MLGELLDFSDVVGLRVGLVNRVPTVGCVNDCCVGCVGCVCCPVGVLEVVPVHFLNQSQNTPSSHYKVKVTCCT